MAEILKTMQGSIVSPPGETCHPASNSSPDLHKAPKTTGERFYDWTQFIVGKLAILGFTAVLAFVADKNHGPDKIAGIPNVLKSFQGWMHDKLLHNKTFPLAEKGEFARRFAGAFASTTVLMHGGNLFAPFMLWLENNHERIATSVNKRFGKEGEADISHERLKDKPKQNWGDVIKGRIGAWMIVFSSFLVADAAAGKMKGTNTRRFDYYEDYIGRKAAGFTANGKSIAATPMSEALTLEQSANPAYRFGKVLALDVFATTAAMVVWTAITRFSAQKRHSHAQANQAHRNVPVVASSYPTVDGIKDTSNAQTLEAEEPGYHRARIQPRSETFQGRLQQAAQDAPHLSL